MPSRLRFTTEYVLATITMPTGEQVLVVNRLESSLAALLAACLFLLLPEQITVGPSWLPLVVVLGLLIPLFTVQAAVRRPGGWNPHPHSIRLIALFTLAIIAVAEAASLVLLITQLPVITEGKLLFRSATLIWGINVLVFSLSYWELDGGGPARRPQSNYQPTDFLFPQQTQESLNAQWAPRYIDYLFLAFNTSTAFSPTDTMILSRQAKLLMMVQSVISLLAFGLVLGRAVNII